MAIVMDRATGEILAIANLDARTPTRRPAPASAPTTAVTTVYEPGSVEKLITVSAALAQGVVQADRRADAARPRPVSDATVQRRHAAPRRAVDADRHPHRVVERRRPHPRHAGRQARAGQLPAQVRSRQRDRPALPVRVGRPPARTVEVVGHHAGHRRRSGRAWPSPPCSSWPPTTPSPTAASTWRPSWSRPPSTAPGATIPTPPSATHRVVSADGGPRDHRHADRGRPRGDRHRGGRSTATRWPARPARPGSRSGASGLRERHLRRQLRRVRPGHRPGVHRHGRARPAHPDLRRAGRRPGVPRHRHLRPARAGGPAAPARPGAVRRRARTPSRRPPPRPTSRARPAGSSAPRRVGGSRVGRPAPAAPPPPTTTTTTAPPPPGSPAAPPGASPACSPRSRPATTSTTSTTSTTVPPPPPPPTSDRPKGAGTVVRPTGAAPSRPRLAMTARLATLLDDLEVAEVLGGDVAVVTA